MQDVRPGDEAALAKLDRAGQNWEVLRQGLDVLAGRDEHAAVLEFVRWWQQETLLRPDPGSRKRDQVPFRPETEAHHDVLDRVVAARRVMLERGAKDQLPDSYYVPCRECGVLFTTEAPHFARTCTSCQRAGPYSQRLGVHVTGALPVFLGGSYPRGPQRPRYAWPTVCEHPECVDIFLAKNRTELYCSAHTRLSAFQAWQQDATPKHERFRFFPNYEVLSEGTAIQQGFLIQGEQRVCIIGSSGFQARDIEEFRPLVERAKATGLLRIVRVP